MNASPPSQAELDQHPRLTGALAIYNRAFRNHIGVVLRRKLGPDWWRNGIVQRISGIQEVIERSDLEAEPTDEDALSLLEPKDYYWIVKEHRENFPELDRAGSHRIAKIGGRPGTLMHEVADWRNVWAHPPSRLEPAAVDRAVDAMIRLVRLFDSDARAELLKLSSQATTQHEPEQSPNATAKAGTEARRIVQQARTRPRGARSEAERDAIGSGTRAETTRKQARQKVHPSVASRSKALVTPEDRDKLDRIQRRVRELQEQETKAQADLKAASHNIRVLERRAGAMERRATEKAKQLVTAARVEAEAIRQRPQRSETFRALLRSATADAEREAVTIVGQAKDEAKTIVARGKAEARKAVDEANQRAASIIKEAKQVAVAAAEVAAPERRADRIRRPAYRESDSASGVPRRVGPPAEPSPRRNFSAGGDRTETPHPLDGFRRRFRPARSGNGYFLPLRVNGWWLNCWVGTQRDSHRAVVFAPEKNKVKAQDSPLIEQDCNSEDHAFEWLRDAEASGRIKREARHAIGVYERFGNHEDDEISY